MGEDAKGDAQGRGPAGRGELPGEETGEGRDPRSHAQPPPDLTDATSKRRARAGDAFAKIAQISSVRQRNALLRPWPRR